MNTPIPMSTQNTLEIETPIEAILRSMVNYPNDHNWDRLDSEACITGATKIDQLKQQNSELQTKCNELLIALHYCRHQACFSIGCSEALSAQLEKIRKVASETTSKYPT